MERALFCHPFFRTLGKFRVLVVNLAVQITITSKYQKLKSVDPSLGLFREIFFIFVIQFAEFVIKFSLLRNRNEEQK